jgi:catechol O-methyltransferase
MKAIDTSGWNEDWLSDAVMKKQPENALEIGAYCGYSAVHIASILPEGSHLTSIDISTDHVAIAREMIEYAGLSDKVTFTVGTVTTCDHCCR